MGINKGGRKKKCIPWNKGIKIWDKKDHPMKGKHHSKETKRNISIANHGKIRTKEHKKNMSKSQKKRFEKEDSWSKGKTYGELYGELKAKAIKYKLSEKSKGKNNPFYGKCHSKKTLKKMGESHKGFKHSEKTKKLMSKASKGFKHSEKTKKLMSKSKTGTVFTKEHCKKISKNHADVSGKNNPMYGKKHSNKVINKQKKLRAKQILPIKDTKIEIKIQNFLKQLKINFIPHKYIKIKHAYQCDIFIPSLNLVIECDGDYWHGNPKMYSKEKLNEKQVKQKQNDKQRTKELKEKGYKVLRLWESEINKMELDNFKKKLEKLK